MNSPAQEQSPASNDLRLRRRIAFLTPEFPTELGAAGGLASYLGRMTRALHGLGHDVEVLTIAAEGSGVLDHDGVRVERVVPRPHGAVRLLGRISDLNWRFRLAATLENLERGIALGRALERRHRVLPFDIVQSSDYSLAGLFVRRRAGRTHLVRSSWAADLYSELDGIRPRFDRRMLYRLERVSLRRADVAYTPSRCLSDFYRREHGIHTEVLRPPFLLEPEPASEVPPGLPERYLLHFGQLGSRKGTDLVVRALPLAWEKEPGLEIVFAGREIRPGAFDRWKRSWAEDESRVRWLGAVERPILYAILSRAVAAVLPSRVDNLPNTVIESAGLSVPVIGTAGASIDEVVEHGRSGELVPLGEVEPLADAMVRAWRGEGAWARDGYRSPAILGEMEPAGAAAGFLRLASRCASPAGTGTVGRTAPAGAGS